MGCSLDFKYRIFACTINSDITCLLFPSATTSPFDSSISTNMPEFPSSLFPRRNSHAGLISNTNSSQIRPRTSPSFLRPSVSTSELQSIHSDTLSGTASIRSHAARMKHAGEGRRGSQRCVYVPGKNIYNFSASEWEQQPTERAKLICLLVLKRAATFENR